MIWRCDLVPQYEEHKEEITEAINRVLSSGRYILAGEVAKFEAEFAAYAGVGHAVSVANGTDALIISLMMFGIGKGDEVITTPFTAIPTVSAIIDAGATPVFVDVDPETFLIDLDQLGSKITGKTKAIMPVHIFGNVVDIMRLKEITRGAIPIIEDASQAHGSRINGMQSGSMGDVGVFSFYPTKNLGAYGDGGMIVTNNAALAEKARLLRMYGMVDYNHIVINGVNSRLDEMQAAVLRVKLRHLDRMNERRNVIAKRYVDELPARHFKHQKIGAGIVSNYHVFVSRYMNDRQKLISFLDAQGIQTNIYYLMPLHLQEANKYLGYKRGDFPNAERICDEVIALTMYPELKMETQDVVIGAINDFLKQGDANDR